MAGELWPHQVEAVTAVTEVIGQGGRTSLIAACGTGKTRIGGAVAARLGTARRVLVVLPTIELLVQTLHAYRAVSDSALGTVVAVCSDPTIAELELLDGEQDIVVTTTSDVLADSVRGRRRVTVLSTYASLPVIAAAHAHHRLGRWDLVVIEAHRTTGRADGPWKVVHHDAQIPATRRLYMTATPRVATNSGDETVSMDDHRIFGEVSYRLPFSRAIAMGLLADYRIVVPVVTNDEIHRLTLDEHLSMQMGASSISPATLAGQIAVLRTMTEYGVRRAISYHHRVADARVWASTLPATAGLMPGGALNLWAAHVSGAQAPHLRRRVIDRLADPGDELAVVSNARVLSEGVDVPAVDAVVFSRPRRSAIDTIQALGRALRTGGRHDKIATIVVPLLLAGGESPEAALEGSDWEPVWQVLRALHDHDDRLDEQLRLQRMRLGEGRLFEPSPSREVKLPRWLVVQGVEVPERFARAITICAVRSTTPSWDEFYGAARAYRHVQGNVDIPGDWVTTEGLRLGNWWQRQKVAYNAGDLTEDRLERLDELGIVWNQLEENWLRTYTDARRLKDTNGHLLVDEDYQTPDGIVLANWFTAQRQRRRVGKLSPDRIRLLEEIEFPWDGVAARWMLRYQELTDFKRRRGTLLRLPNTSREARWIEVQLATHKRGHLTAEQIQLLHDIGIDFRDRKETLWRNTYEELAAFHTEEGHWTIPEDLMTIDGVRLRSWATAQRTARKANNRLADWQIALLDKIGFPWDPLQQLWDQRLAELAYFVAHKGHINIPHGTPLRSWLYQQRKKHRAGTLTDEAAAKLAAIDPLWHDEDASVTSETTRRFFALTDQSWAKIQPLLPSLGGEVWTNNDHRFVLENIIWKLRTDARWEDMIVQFGSYVTVSSWYYQWEKNGIWTKIESRIVLQARRTSPVPVA